MVNATSLRSAKGENKPHFVESSGTLEEKGKVLAKGVLIKIMHLVFSRGRVDLKTSYSFLACQMIRGRFETMSRVIGIGEPTRWIFACPFAKINFKEGII
jgi:hypothetical protein